MTQPPPTITQEGGLANYAITLYVNFDKKQWRRLHSSVTSIGIIKNESLIRLITIFTKKLYHRCLTKFGRYASDICVNFCSLVVNSIYNIKGIRCDSCH